MNALLNFIVENHTAVSLAVLHFSHLAWPKIKYAVKTAFPWLATHGGISGVGMVAWRGLLPMIDTSNAKEIVKVASAVSSMRVEFSPSSAVPASPSQPPPNPS